MSDWLKIPVLMAIRLYQKSLSPDHGFLKVLYPNGFCKFNPSCSQYSYDAILKYGVIKGSVMAIHRIFRCQPWSKGGNDPVK